MGAARGQANHSLYLSRLLLAAWQRAVEEEDVPASTLSQAWLPAVRGHLLRAYGWFLLEITRPEPLPGEPPHCCAELPQPAAGKALPGEIREFAHLEENGWIGEMLAAAPPGGARAPAIPGNLASGDPVIGPEQARRWADEMQRLFDRMGDSLDEY